MKTTVTIPEHLAQTFARLATKFRVKASKPVLCEIPEEVDIEVEYDNVQQLFYLGYMLGVNDKDEFPNPIQL
jgi:hypothetical protein